MSYSAGVSVAAVASLCFSLSLFAYIIYIVACSVGIYNLRDESESAKKS